MTMGGGLTVRGAQKEVHNKACNNNVLELQAAAVPQERSPVHDFEVRAGGILWGARELNGGS